MVKVPEVLLALETRLVMDELVMATAELAGTAAMEARVAMAPVASLMVFSYPVQVRLVDAVTMAAVVVVAVVVRAVLV